MSTWKKRLGNRRRNGKGYVKASYHGGDVVHSDDVSRCNESSDNLSLPRSLEELYGVLVNKLQEQGMEITERMINALC